MNSTERERKMATKNHKWHWGRGATLGKHKSWLTGGVPSWNRLFTSHSKILKTACEILDSPEGQEICEMVVRDNRQYKLTSNHFEREDGTFRATVFMLRPSHDNKFFTLVVYGVDSEEVDPMWLVKYESEIKLKDYNRNFSWTDNAEWIDD